MTRSEITSHIPHRPPMLLIDEILSRQETQIVCRKTFRADEFFFQGHYPDHPLVPGVILCEVAMQAGAILLSHIASNLKDDDKKVENSIPVATRLNNVRFRRMVQPGETVEVEVDLIEQLAQAFFLKGKISADGKDVLRLEFACALAPPPTR